MLLQQQLLLLLPRALSSQPLHPQGYGWRVWGVAQQLQTPRKSRNLFYSRDEGEVITLGTKKFPCLWKWYLRSTLWSKFYPELLRLFLWLGTGLPRADISVLIFSSHCVLLSGVWVLQSPELKELLINLEDAEPRVHYLKCVFVSAKQQKSEFKAPYRAGQTVVSFMFFAVQALDVWSKLNCGWWSKFQFILSDKSSELMGAFVNSCSVVCPRGIQEQSWACILSQAKGHLFIISGLSTLLWGSTAAVRGSLSPAVPSCLWHCCPAPQEAAVGWAQSSPMALAGSLSFPSAWSGAQCPASGACQRCSFMIVLLKVFLNLRIVLPTFFYELA